MAYRFTYTGKWRDGWFSKLRPMEKLTFNYLCDNCDIAGFIEVNHRIWTAEIGIKPYILEGALKGLARGLIYSKDKQVIYVRTFLKHQKNYPLNPDNKAHRGIIYKFQEYSQLFDIKDINDFLERCFEGASKGLQRGFEGASKGLQSPTGIGIGNGIGKKEDIDIDQGNIPTWDEFLTYAKEKESRIDKKKLQLKYQSWVENDWKDGNDKEIKNWKTKLLNTIPYIGTIEQTGYNNSQNKLN